MNHSNEIAQLKATVERLYKLNRELSTLLSLLHTPASIPAALNVRITRALGAVE